MNAAALSPRVSVQMSVYNGAAHVRRAVDSILAQTFTDFEFVIVDDGSTDATPEVLNSLADPRIRVLRNEHNLGLTRALNRALHASNATYIAHLDADDRALPDRLALQVAFLDAHLEVGVVGSAYQIVNQDFEPIAQDSRPLDHDSLAGYLLCNCCFCHSTTMFRRELVVRLGGYNERYRYAQDYDLWQRVSRVARLAALPNVLVQWTSGDPNSITVARWAKQQEAALQISTCAISEALAGDPNSASLDLPAYQRYWWVLHGEPRCQPGDSRRLLPLWRFLAARAAYRRFWGPRLAKAAYVLTKSCPDETRHLAAIVLRYFWREVPWRWLFRTAGRDVVPRPARKRMSRWIHG